VRSSARGPTLDASFVNDELLGEDAKERDALRKSPAGIGTMVFAGRPVQSGGGASCPSTGIVG